MLNLTLGLNYYSVNPNLTPNLHQVRERAVDAVLGPLLLERLFQQIATQAEPLLLQRHAGQWLDQICARNTVCK